MKKKQRTADLTDAPCRVCGQPAPIDSRGRSLAHVRYSASGNSMGSCRGRGKTVNFWNLPNP